jgi:hypothetical protein
MSDEKMRIKIWVTKFAITKGVYTAMATVDGQKSQTVGVVASVHDDKNPQSNYLRSYQFETTREDAQRVFDEKRELELESLRKRIERIESLPREVPE